MTRFAAIACAASAALLLCGCLSANPETISTAPARTPARVATSAATASVSQPQPGSNGTVISGTITIRGAAPPPNSSLYLALVKSPTDQQPRICIDAERNPVDAAGKFSARAACSPQAGDQLMYTLIVGPAGLRNWHSGVVPLPSDLTSVRLDAPE